MSPRLEEVYADLDPLTAEPSAPANSDRVLHSNVGPIDDDGPLACLEERLLIPLNQVVGVRGRGWAFRRSSILDDGADFIEVSTTCMLLLTLELMN